MRASVTAWIVVASALALVLLAAAPAVAGAPQTGDFFEFDQTVTVNQGTGYYYDGYTETTQSHYRYAVQGVSGDQVTVAGTGSWTYSNSTGSTLSGNEPYNLVFSASTRGYLSGIDVVVPDPATAKIWFWIPTPAAVGQVIYILNDPLTVTSTASTYWIGAVPHTAVVLEGSGTYDRNDVYGTFTAEYSDTYYFDPTTGFILAEKFYETDNGYGTYAGNSFVNSTTLTVTSSSYSPPLDLGTILLLYLGVPAAVVLVVVGVVLVRRGPSRLKLGSGPSATYVRIKKVKNAADTTNLTPDGSPFFGPFLPIFAERSFAEGDPVVFALDDRKIVGMALMDRESGMGSLFASEDKVAKVLLKRVRMSDFFADATIPARVLGAKEVDRFSILQLRNPQAVDYDSDVVRPMTAEDLPAVIAMTENVYRGRAVRFIESSFKAGDLGFVATSAGRIMGFGFATVVGTVARLHTLTVAPGDRARGIGTQIMNARLSTLAALGVDRVIVEISKQNAASLRIATTSGFTPIGETVYYARNPPSAPSAIQRQT